MKCNVDGETLLIYMTWGFLAQPPVSPAPQRRFPPKAAIIGRLTSSRCYNRMLQKWTSVPRHLAVCHRWRWQKSCRSCTAAEGGRRSWLGGAYEYESRCCLGFHSALTALTAPVFQISFSQHIPFQWETERRGCRRLKRPDWARGQSPRCPDANYWSDD